MVSYIPYILAFMIVYDFYGHIFDLLRLYKKTKLHAPGGPGLIFDFFSKGDQEKRRKVYQIFWNIYWGVASVLAIIYLFSL